MDHTRTESNHSLNRDRRTVSSGRSRPITSQTVWYTSTSSANALVRFPTELSIHGTRMIKGTCWGGEGREYNLLHAFIYLSFITLSIVKFYSKALSIV